MSPSRKRLFMEGSVVVRNFFECIERSRRYSPGRSLHRQGPPRDRCRILPGRARPIHLARTISHVPSRFVQRDCSRARRRRSSRRDFVFGLAAHPRNRYFAWPGRSGCDVLHLILGQGAKLALLGLGIGVMLAFLLTRFLASMLYGVTATDPLTYLRSRHRSAQRRSDGVLHPSSPSFTQVDPSVALRYQ